MSSKVLVALTLALAISACGDDDRMSADSGASDARMTDAGAGATFVAVGCTPSARLVLDEIPDDPSLDDADEDTLATFEVEGHQLIGKFVRDQAAAEIGLDLWQELTTRVPANQLRDLVQYEVFGDDDPSAIFNRNGDVTTQRTGLKIGFSIINAERNDSDPCAPLVPRRGSFDWSLIHEFGHLRGWVDGSWPLFLDTFPDVMGEGDGYPSDGSPVLTGDFVTSYAERDDGDEDHAESFTTFVMLDEATLPPQSAGEALALQKVRWMYEQPGLRALRQAIRGSEAGGGDVWVPQAPLLSERL